jgi:phosphonate degradation associated HDIG domain protein
MAGYPRDTRVSDTLQLFHESGGSQYGGENVTQLEHALQAAFFAERHGASANLIAAALLHDVGHLLHTLPDDAPSQGVDDAHEELAARWLADRFAPAVCEPVRMHVLAKRYLCTVEATYYGTLSEPSRLSMQLQGGKMSDEERDEFESSPFAEEAAQLRRWDDAAKVVGLKTPDLEHFAKYLEAAD